MNPTLKAPGTNCLKLKHAVLLSGFAFKFNLRRYNKVVMARAGDGACVAPHGRAVQVDPIKPTLKALGTKRLKVKCDKLLSTLAFKFSLRRYTTAGSRASARWRIWR
jgi:hypothetical protein